jgi:hypothetical protein
MQHLQWREQGTVVIDAVCGPLKNSRGAEIYAVLMGQGK